MLRVRVDGGQLSLEQLRVIADISQEFAPGHRRHHRPAEHPAPLDPGRGHAGDLAAARGGRPADHRGVRRLPPGGARQPGRRRRRRRGARRHPGRSRRSSTGSSATRRSPTCRASSSRRCPGCPTCRTRSTTSRSSASITPTTAPASTSGSAAACRPTRCWPSGSASGCRWTRCPTSGPAWSASSATTATAGCGTGPGSSSWSPTGAWRSSARCWRRNTSAAKLVDGPGAGAAGQADRPHRRAPAARRALLRRRRAGRRPGLRDTARPSSPTSSRRTAAAGCGSPRTRSCWSSTSRRSASKSLVTALREIGLEARPSTWRRGTMACTGIEYCKLAIVETKARGAGTGGPPRRAARRHRRRDHHQHQRLPERLRPHPGRRHRPQGTAGGRRPTADRSRASRCTSAVAWAWRRARTAGFGRKLRGLKTTADELPAYVERLARRYLDGRTGPARRSRSGWSGPTRRRCGEHREPRGTELLPVLRRRGPASPTRSRTVPGSAAAASGSSRSSSSACWPKESSNPRTEEVR